MHLLRIVPSLLRAQNALFAKTKSLILKNKTLLFTWPSALFALTAGPGVQNPAHELKDEQTGRIRAETYPVFWRPAETPVTVDGISDR